MARVAVCIALCLAAAGIADAAAVNDKLRKQGANLEGFVRSLDFKHRLRVCNAYPIHAGLDVYRGKDKLTSDGAMPYKACNDFDTPLKEDDKLEFKVGDSSAGTFSVADLPQNDAVLMLIIHRHDTLSTAVSFESHVFANLQNAQIAIIDTYKGKERSTPQITDANTTKGAVARSEELRFESVVAVNPGLYNVALVDSDGKEKSKTQLVALNRESYVVLRVGVDAKHGDAYPAELVVFPKSDASVFKSAAAGRAALLAPLIAAAAAFLRC